MEINNYISILINSTLLIKIGSAPFHFWFPNIIEGLSWINCFILITWQKISPIILLSYHFFDKFLIIILILNVIIGAIGGLNQTSLRKLLAFSSINNLGWILSSIIIRENLWIFYFIFYRFLRRIRCFLFFIFNVYFINQLFIINLNIIIKLSLIINFLSLAGLPPFIGFFPKWIVINFILKNKFFILIFIFIIIRLIILLYYIRIIYSSFIFNYFKLKWFKIKIKNNFFNFINFLRIISILGIIIRTLFFL